MAEPECTFCEKPAEHECPTCHNLYCDDHGDDICLRCAAPEAALPGAFLYRGSLLVLGIASILAIWLFIRPPEDEAPAASDRPVPAATSAFSATATATAAGDRPSPTATAIVLPATPTPVITPSPTPPTNTYEIQSGDTLGAIAEEFDTTVEEILAANPEITDAGSIAPGQIIIIP
jgi:hypothetical protein